ncbi:MAG: MopE-related protein, partial [Myxococcota bacterium]
RAETYYVAHDGASAWQQCTVIGSPCSWQTAMANAVADDLVYFQSGTYDVEDECSGSWEYIAMAPANSGTAGHPITFMAYPGHTPRVNGCISNESPAFGARDVDYIIWDGFSSGTLHDSDRENWFFLYWNSNYSIVRNCTFAGIDSALGDGHRNSAPIRVEDAHDVEIYDNDLRCSGGQVINSACVYLFAAVRTKVHHNTMHEGDYGVMQKINVNTDNEIYNNFIHSLAYSGVVLTEENVDGSGHKVHHNVFVDIGQIAVETYPNGTALQHGAQFFNNTIHNARDGIVLSEDSRSGQVWNNIIAQPTRAFLTYDTGAALPAYCDYNNFHGSGTRTEEAGYDTHSITTDPGFVNAGGMTPESYKRTSYPTNGRGAPFDSVMGAYVTGDELIGTRSGGAVAPTCTDVDSDGYGSPASSACTHSQLDCDDNAGAVHPGASEQCNGIDDNCVAGTTDEVCPACVSGATRECYSGALSTRGVGACQDGNQACVDEAWPLSCADEVLPATEHCSDAVDNDCDGAIDATDSDCPDACADADGDGYPNMACDGSDCNDSDNAISPGAEEVCGDRIDNDCDGDVDSVPDDACTRASVSSGCSCAATLGPWVGLWVIAAPLVLRRRRSQGAINRGGAPASQDLPVR